MSQIYFKSMRRQFYVNGKVINTRDYNYGLVAGGVKKDGIVLLQMFVDLSQTHGLSFESLVTFAMKANAGELPSSLITAIATGNPTIDLHWYLLGGPPTGQCVDSDTLHRLYKFAAANSFLSDQKTIPVRLWEYLYESVRSEHRPERPKRLECFFALKDAESVTRYRKKHGLGAVTCRVGAKGCKAAFEGDMTLLDNISPNSNHAEALPQILRYWDQEHSSDPLIEVLLQGKVKLLNEL